VDASWGLVVVIAILGVFGVLPLVRQRALLAARERRLRALQRRRGSVVITLIHRQEQISLLGFPVVRYIDIDDAESVLRAINETPAGRPIEIILHTPGGMVIAARQIATALADHDGPVTAVVPHYAMSGGTLIALAADEILLDAHASLGPVDPQLGQYPAASLVEVSERPGDHEDQTLIMADMGRKAIAQLVGITQRLVARYMPEERATRVARILATGTWTHDHPLQVPDLQTLGLPVRVGVPETERDLMQLYPQPRGRQPAVEYAPGPPVLPAPRQSPSSAGRGAPRGR
jgi:ClpP class serine protease